MNADDQLIVRANELYHDVEADLYDAHHPEILSDELERWRRLALLLPPSPRTILDIGTGTGFVPMVLMPFLTNDDQLICSDLSAAMIEITRRNLAGAGSSVKVHVVRVDARSMPFADRGLDVITMNSVLHHIPDVSNFLSRAARLLRPGGVMFIGHEPNALFWRHPFLPSQYVFAGKLVALANRRRRAVPRPCADNAFSDEVNRRLVQRGFLSDPLSPNELSAVVDIHSPTAGGLHRERGFLVSEIVRASGMTLRFAETYDHLSKLSDRFPRYSSAVSRLAPSRGSLFSVVLERPTTA